MRRPLALLVALSLVLVGAGCGDDDDGGSAAPTTAEDADDGTDELELSGDLEVELLDAGQEPRQVLRLRPTPDCEQQVTQRQELTQRAVSGEVDGVPLSEEALGQASRETGSSTEYDITYRCDQLDEERIEVTNHYDDVRIVAGPDDQSAETEQLLQGFVGAEGHIVYDTQGRILEAEAPDVDIDEDVLGPEFAAGMEQMLDSLGSTIEQSASPFPEEPIGVGGRWQVTAEIDINGLQARSVTQYTITRLEGDEVEATLASSMEFVPGEMDFPGMPAGGAAEIVAGETEGTGAASWNLTDVVGYMDQVLDGTLTMRITASDGTIEMSLAQHQVLSLQPR